MRSPTPSGSGGEAWNFSDVRDRARLQVISHDQWPGSSGPGLKLDRDRDGRACEWLHRASRIGTVRTYRS
jgi:hypothetical protein